MEQAKFLNGLPRNNWRMRATVLLALMALMLAVPVTSARIGYNVAASYDANGMSECYGEEIHVVIELDAGANPASDIEVDIVELDALIDDHTFKKTIIPANAPINLTQRGHSFFCDRLGVGERVRLEFDAYPKTLMSESIDVARIHVSYTQLGERLHDDLIINASLKDSAWDKYRAAEEEIKGLEMRAAAMRWTLYAATLLAIAGVVMLGLGWRERGRQRESVRNAYKDAANFLESLLEMVEDATLKNIIEGKINEYRRLTSAGKEGGD